jgi:glyoxylase-like metal-dependent hydrolase (beta-lactamase superfamily II)
MLYPIDLEFLGFQRAISVYLLETTDGLALFDCGPATTLPHLRRGLRELDLELSDVRHLFLSHIHFDHAGAVGPIVREHPGLTVWVSEVGAPHLIDPSRLEASARRLYLDRFDTLWGELAPVPERNIRIAHGDVLGWEAFPSPGHASHHVCYLRGGTLLAGDTCGVRPQPAEYVLPVSPPPDIDVEAWHHTIDEIRGRAPERLALTHFGVETGAKDHLDRLGAELDRWAELVRDGVGEDEFTALGNASVGDDIELCARVAGFGQSWQGLRRYWDKRAPAA